MSSGAAPPVVGPCSPWIDETDVMEFCGETCTGEDGGASNPTLLSSVAAEASAIMWEVSGWQFSGECGPVTVRPCRQSCGCWGAISMGLGPWYWTSAFYGGGGGYFWRNECGDRCGCGTASYVRLSGYPVIDITEVKIDGDVLDPSEYRLERNRRLMRTSDPGPPVHDRLWPSCQNLTLDDDQPGTFSISYTHGVAPPQLGKDAAAQLACELFSARTTGECQLPSRVTEIVREGITMKRLMPLSSLLRMGETGLVLIDTFIGTYNPAGLRRRPAVYSPDLQPFAVREAQ